MARKHKLAGLVPFLTIKSLICIAIGAVVFFGVLGAVVLHERALTAKTIEQLQSDLATSSRVANEAHARILTAEGTLSQLLNGASPPRSLRPFDAQQASALISQPIRTPAVATSAETTTTAAAVQPQVGRNLKGADFDCGSDTDLAQDGLAACQVECNDSRCPRAHQICEKHRCTHISLNSDASFATLKRDPTAAVDVAGATSHAFVFEQSADKLAQMLKMSNTNHGKVNTVGQTFVWELAPKTSWISGTRQCDLGGVQGAGTNCNGYQCFIGKCLFDGDGTQPLEAATRKCPQWDSSLEGSTIRKEGKNLQFADYDRCNFYSTGYGIPYVSRDRWRKAQSFEANYHIGKTGDRQDVHTTWFRNYASIFGVELGNVLEIGSGAFSQVKEVFDVASMKTVTLVDPLMGHYVTNVAGCNYKSGKLLNKYTTLLVQAGGEDVDFDQSFDTVVMMNVLEHCINAIHVLQNMHNAVMPGGILVFSERWYDTKWQTFERDEQPFWDVGHPISIKKQVVDHLLQFYEPIYSQGFHFQDPFFENDEGVYFIGRKKNSGRA